MVEIKKKWEEEHPGEPLLAGLIEEAKSLVSKADPELRKSLLLGIKRAKQAISKLIRNREPLDGDKRKRQAPLDPEAEKKRAEAIAALKAKIAAARAAQAQAQVQAGGAPGAPAGKGVQVSVSASAPAAKQGGGGLLGGLLGTN